MDHVPIIMYGMAGVVNVCFFIVYKLICIQLIYKEKLKQRKWTSKEQVGRLHIHIENI